MSAMPRGRCDGLHAAAVVFDRPFPDFADKATDPTDELRLSA